MPHSDHEWEEGAWLEGVACSGQCWDSMHSLNNRFPRLHIVVCVCGCADEGAVS